MTLDEHATRYRRLARRILSAAEEGRPRESFVGRALRLLLEDAGASRIVLRIREHGEEVSRTLVAGAAQVRTERAPAVPAPDEDGLLRRLDPEGRFTTRLGSVFADRETLSRLRALPEDRRPAHVRGVPLDGATTAAWLPLAVSADPRAVLALARDGAVPLDRMETRLYEALAQILVVALDQQSARWALAERIKELTCLFEVARVAADRELPFDEALRRVAASLPPAFQHPAGASARIVVDGEAHATSGFLEGPCRLVADVVAHGVKRGTVEVHYDGDLDAGEDPFLREERALLAAVAGEAGRLIEREKATRDRARLEEQLRHADRLATIGTLAAGVAHELNEPLGSVLGFAQLAGKTEDLPRGTAQDLDKIVKATLHAREIVRKLMLFARHEPPRPAPLRVDAVVGEALDLLALRCARAGVAVERALDAALPAIVADAAQIRQVVVNLAVNAIQAMPKGGRLTATAAADGAGVAIEIADDGVGMDEATRRRRFTPFFTTNDVGAGTGRGLAVAHGIVTAHGGTIEVESAPGKGSRFRVRLPAGGV